MAKKVKKIDKRVILRMLAVVFSFILPLMLLIVSVFILNKTKRVREKIFEEKIEVKEGLIPSQILNNKPKYNQQRITIRGRVSPEPVVCERKDCPTNDSCCGCPSERNLIIYDSGAVLTSKTGGRLRLSDAEGKPFCHRRQSSCEYHCGDWIKGAIYDVSGMFFAEPPPAGWKLSLEYYFQVESKNLIKRVSLGESIGNILKEIREMVERIKTSGYYILP